MKWLFFNEKSVVVISFSVFQIELTPVVGYYSFNKRTKESDG